MRWDDDAIIISTRAHGETSAIVEVLARREGRSLGLVKGGRSRQRRAALQPGNLVRASWSARLAEHLGNFTVELQQGFAARAMEDKAALAAIGAMGAFARLLPERDPHPELFDAMLAVLQGFEGGGWLADYAEFEMLLLQELGFGLDLSECAATGARENLIYVSPKSGRAVSAVAGEPYRERLLPLPAFLLTGGGPQTPDEVASCLRLTGHFLEKDALAPGGQRLPECRAIIVWAASAS